MKLYWILGIIFLLNAALYAQSEPTKLKVRKSNAVESIRDLKKGGAIIVRLKTKHRKIAILERNVRGLEGKPKRQERYEKMLNGTLKYRDAVNSAMIEGFRDSFSFCPVYFMYDSSSSRLHRGAREGLFLGQDLNIDPSIAIQEKNLFIVDFQKESAEFPFDVLKMRRLTEKLEDPFPYFAQVRESFLNEINTPRIAGAAKQWSKRLSRFYTKRLDKIAVLEAKEKEEP
ncbi:MAG: hypothetical protein GY810_21380 [Aureispira sp.]|nr:hypothetical protein [Aureispira sp.]